jgi:hypothetical protein
MLSIRPNNISEAVAFVIKHHRRLGAPPAGDKFAIAVEDDFRRIRGVLIGARPVARALDDERTLEIARVATDGMRNANSKLYGHAWRIAKAKGDTGNAHGRAQRDRRWPTAHARSYVRRR